MRITHINDKIIMKMVMEAKSSYSSYIYICIYIGLSPLNRNVGCNSYSNHQGQGCTTYTKNSEGLARFRSTSAFLYISIFYLKIEIYIMSVFKQLLFDLYQLNIASEIL